MNDDRPISEDDLQAYVDGRLESRRRTQVDAYLAGHADLAARIASDIGHRDALRGALAQIAEEPIPVELTLAGLIESRRRPAWDSWRSIAAAVLLLVVGGACGWSLHGLATPPAAGIASLAREAVDSYAVYEPDRTRPVELAASDRQQLLKWVSQRLDRPVGVPDLSASGFRFIGGRLVATPHGPAVLYMFDSRRGTRLVMLARPMAIDKNSTMRPTVDGGVAAISWATDGLGFSLVGRLDPERLHPIADIARSQLDREI